VVTTKSHGFGASTGYGGAFTAISAAMAEVEIAAARTSE
jgi:hypothetical protein